MSKTATGLRPRSGKRRRLLDSVRGRRRGLEPEGGREVVLGTLRGIDADGAPRVAVELRDREVPARTAVCLSQRDVGRQVVLVFPRGGTSEPIVLATVREDPFEPEPGSPLNISADGKSAVLEVEHEITVRAGKASITLRSDGKIVIRGTDVVSRSSGSNRLKGASVRIN